MRIAQITLTGYFNYGNMLQKYALHNTLKRFTEFTEVLWFDTPRLFSETIKERHAQCELKSTRKEDREYMEAFYRREAIRQSKFRDFENLHVKTRFDFPYFEDIADEYDFLLSARIKFGIRDGIRHISFSSLCRVKRKFLTLPVSPIPQSPTRKKNFFGAAFPILITFPCAKKNH